MYKVIFTLVLAVASLMGFMLKISRYGGVRVKTSTADFNREWRATTKI
jgi:hypothetical protein